MDTISFLQSIVHFYSVHVAYFFTQDKSISPMCFVIAVLMIYSQSLEKWLLLLVLSSCSFLFNHGQYISPFSSLFLWLTWFCVSDWQCPSGCVQASSCFLHLYTVCLLLTPARVSLNPNPLTKCHLEPGGLYQSLSLHVATHLLVDTLVKLLKKCHLCRLCDSGTKVCGWNPFHLLDGVFDDTLSGTGLRRLKITLDLSVKLRVTDFVVKSLLKFIHSHLDLSFDLSSDETLNSFGSAATCQ